MSSILIATEKIPPDFAGAGLRAFRFIQRMKDRYKYDVKMVCSYKKNKSELDKSLSIIRLNAIRENSIFFPLHLLDLIIKADGYLFKNRKEIDVIHFFGFAWLNRAIMLSNVLFYRKPTILEITLEGVDDPISLQTKGWKNKLFKPVTRFLLKRIDKFIVPSSHSLKSCILLGKNKKDVLILPHPCEINDFAKIRISKKNELRRKLGLPTDYFILLNVGRIHPRKNQLFLINCIKLLNNNKILLVLIGPYEKDRYYSKIIEYINENKLQKQIFLLGEQQNVNEYMIASDLLVFASKNEGFPNVISESIMSGLPIITTYFECIKDYVNKKIGVVIKNNEAFDSKVLVQFVRSINSVYKKSIQFNRSFIRRVGIEKLSTEEIDKKYNELYHLLLLKQSPIQPRANSP